jgi:hypothetical protein
MGMRIDQFIRRLNGEVLLLKGAHDRLEARLLRMDGMAEPDVHLLDEAGAAFMIVSREMHAYFEVPAVGKPPLFLQCHPAWAGVRYAPEGRMTFCQAGCLVCSAASLVAWMGEYAGVSPVTFAAAVGVDGGFVGDMLGHPSAVERAFPALKWHGRGDGAFWSERYQRKETSFIDWHNRSADLGLLRELLERQPVVVEVDYKPPTKKVDQHFVLAYKYIPDPEDGLNDDLLVMDPMTGYTSVLTYFNPGWLGAWMRQNKITKVGRTLMGARVWETPRQGSG